MGEKEEELIEKGGIRARLYLEAQGKSPELIEKAKENLIKDLKKKCYVVKVSSEEPIFEANMFSTIAEVEIIAYSLRNLFDIVMSFGPSAVEILEPDEIIMNIGDLQAILVDISQLIYSLTHQLLAVKKRLSNEQKIEKAS